MKKLSKEQVSAVTATIESCSEIQQKIERLIEGYNQRVEEFNDALQPVLDEYNEKVAAIREIYQEAANDAQSYFDERSDTWQEGEKGEVYAEWINQLENVDLEDLEVEVPDRLDEPMYHDWENPESWLPPNSPGE